MLNDGRPSMSDDALLPPAHHVRWFRSLSLPLQQIKLQPRR